MELLCWWMELSAVMLDGVVCCYVRWNAAVMLDGAVIRGWSAVMLDGAVVLVDGAAAGACEVGAVCTAG